MRPSDNHNADWHAEVYLLRQFDLKHPGRGQDTAFPGWTHTSSPGKIPFAKTGNPAQLEEIIACAQRATLSPMVDYKLFLDPSYRNLHMHSTLFSPNPVGISIRKPNLPALSFFDLPGLIGQAETEEEAYTVPLVQNLVSMYVQDPEALVLVTAALENDLATSTAAGLARDLKATTRCIGKSTNICYAASSLSRRRCSDQARPTSNWLILNGARQDSGRTTLRSRPWLLRCEEP